VVVRRMAVGIPLHEGVARRRKRGDQHAALATRLPRIFL